MQDYKDDIPPFFKEQFEDTRKGLLKCTHNPDASYLLGQDYQQGTMSITITDPRKAIEAYSKDQSARHQLAILHIQDHTKRYFPKGSSFEDYQALGDSGYSPAYIEALVKVKDQEKRLELINKAVEQNYMPAYIHQGWHYIKNRDTKQALASFEAAGKQGVSEGYLLYVDAKAIKST